MTRKTVYPPKGRDAAESSFREAPGKLRYDSGRLERLCRERGITRLDLFGSALRDDFRAESDVDLLATLRPDACVTLFDWADIRERLSEIFGRSVDLVSRRAIERSQNPYRKHSILSAAVPIYVQG